MTSTAKSDATGYVIAREADGARGVAPVSGFFRVQPNPGGIQGHEPQLIDVARNPLNKFATDEEGKPVGLNAKPVLVHDLTKDFADRFADGWTRSVAKVPGNKGLAIYYPTAVVDGGAGVDSFTVPLLGDLTDGLLIRVRGCKNAANNGVFKLSGGSVAGSIRVATGTLVAEAIAVVGSVTLEVCGVELAVTDCQIDVNGDITTTAFDCTTLNLTDGHELKIGDTAAGTRFAIVSDTYNGWATVNGAVTIHKIPLKWRTWTVAGADAGTGKTIRLLFGRCYRNVATDNTDYREPSWWGEKEDLGVGVAGGPVYTNLSGMTLIQASFAIPVQAKIVVTQNFEGMDIQNPIELGARLAGPAAAYPAVAMELFDSTNDVVEMKVYDASDDSLLVAEINSCTLTIDHGVEAQHWIGTFGAADMNFGKNRPKGQMEIYYRRATVPQKIRGNNTGRVAMRLRNGQAGFSWHMPAIKLRGGAMKYDENKPVMVSLELPAFRDQLTNIVEIINVLPYVPLT